MNLEYKLILGTLLISEGVILFTTTKLISRVDEVKRATTKFLDSATSYFSRRVSRPEDINSLARLAKYRKECGI